MTLIDQTIHTVATVYSNACMTSISYACPVLSCAVLIVAHGLAVY
jgi:hypothetical protein